MCVSVSSNMLIIARAFIFFFLGIILFVTYVPSSCSFLNVQLFSYTAADSSTCYYVRISECFIILYISLIVYFYVRLCMVDLLISSSIYIYALLKGCDFFICFCIPSCHLPFCSDLNFCGHHPPDFPVFQTFISQVTSSLTPLT